MAENPRSSVAKRKTRDKAPTSPNEGGHHRQASADAEAGIYCFTATCISKPTSGDALRRAPAHQPQQALFGGEVHLKHMLKLAEAPPNADITTLYQMADREIHAAAQKWEGTSFPTNDAKQEGGGGAAPRHVVHIKGGEQFSGF